MGLDKDLGNKWKRKYCKLNLETIPPPGYLPTCTIIMYKERWQRVVHNGVCIMGSA